MHTAVRTLGISLTILHLLGAAPAHAAVYRCTENSQTTYSAEPCGKQAQEVQTQVSVTSPFVPPEPAAERKSGGLLEKIGLGASDGITTLLLALIPLLFVAMFFFSGKPQNAK